MIWTTAWESPACVSMRRARQLYLDRARPSVYVDQADADAAAKIMLAADT